MRSCCDIRYSNYEMYIWSLARFEIYYKLVSLAIQNFDCYRGGKINYRYI